MLTIDKSGCQQRTKQCASADLERTKEMGAISSTEPDGINAVQLVNEPRLEKSFDTVRGRERRVTMCGPIRRLIGGIGQFFSL
jgi:hypothetical protein